MCDIRKTSEFFIKPLGLFFIFIYFIGVAAAQDGGDERRNNLLILHSYHQGLSWTDNLTRGIVNRLREHYDLDELEIHIEYMDTKRFSLEDVEESIYSLLSTRYRDKDMDVVVVCDNNALTFMKKYHDKLFPDVPVVFTGINYYNDSLIGERNLYTGVMETSSADGTVDLMMRMHPDLKRCVVISDVTVTGQRELASAKNKLSTDYKGIEIEYWDSWSIHDLEAGLKTLLPGRDAVLLLVYNRSPNGVFFNYEDSAKLFSSLTDCPIYGIWDFYLGTGVLGGRMIHSVSQGSEAVELVLRVLKGESPADIPLVSKDLTRSLFDAALLNERGIAFTSLPDGARAMDKETIIFESGSHPPLRIGILTMGDKEEAVERWQYLADYLTWNVEKYYFEVLALGYDEIMTGLQQAQFDFSLTDPFLFVDVASRGGLYPLATQKSLYAGKVTDRVGSVIFVRSIRDDLQSILDLKGATVGLLNKSRLCEWRMAKREMIEQGFDPDEEIRSFAYFETHEDIVEAVLNGQVDFGVVRTGVLEDMARNDKVHMDFLRMLNELPATPGFPFRRSSVLYPGRTFAALPSVSSDLTHKVEHALVMMNTSDPIVENAGDVGWTDTLNHSQARDCQMVLREGPFVDLKQPGYWETMIKYWPWLAGFAAALILSLTVTAYVVRINGRIRQMAQDLKASEERYRRMFEKHPSIKLLLNAKTGKIADANAAAIDFYGYPREQLIGKPIKKINILSDDEVKSRMQAVEEGRKTHFYFQHRLASGDIRDVEVHSGLLKIDNEDLILSIIHDVSDRFRAEQKLRRSEEKVKSVFDQLGDVVWSLNWPDLTVNYMSPSCKDVFGYSMQDFVDNPTLWKDLVVFEDKPDIEETMATLLEEGHGLREYRAVRADGSQVWIRDKSQVIYDENGNMIRIDGISSDISDVKEREKAILELDRQEQQTRRHSSLMTLAAAIAHNFNNNLHVVIGHLEMMQTARKTRTPIEENISEAIKAAKVAAQNSQLMLLYVGQGQDFRLCHIQDVVRNELAKYEKHLPPQIQFQPQIDSEQEFPVNGDPERIATAVGNVISNAIESMNGKGGVLQLRIIRSELDAEALSESRIHFVPPPGDFVCIEITDHGSGMDNSTLERMFEPFFSTRFMGRGTGLAAVYGILLGHEGAIFVDTSEFIGTTVTLCFPAYKRAIATHGGSNRV